MAEYEKYWLKVWNERRIFESEPVKEKKKVFVTFPFPYMNGPVHVGHCFTSTRVDVFARFKRLQGFNVLFPWAWHWTGESIVGASYRLSQGDEQIRKGFVQLDRVPESEVSKFTDPEYLASYYTKVSRQVVKDTGFSVDWRREFTTVDPAFKKFVEWQYLRLRELGYVVQGTHPVVWCSLDQSPTGDHDRLEGVGVSVEEFNLVKFRMADFALVAGTLRPETIYGATNVWVDPEAEYSEARVDGELWIVSSSAVRRLTEQKRSVTPLRSFKGSDLVGKSVKAPMTNKPLPILPSGFVDAQLATGVVYSVPAHAPYDYAALKDLQAGKIGATRQIQELAKKITPISIISVPGFGDFPAQDEVRKLGILSATDPKLEHATAELYKAEFHNGVMKNNTGEFAGRKVSEAKAAIIDTMAKQHELDKMLELPEQVVCRCGTRCYVKILENQWFLNYSNPDWKEKTKRLISEAKLFPPESKEWYFATIDWLRDWPCARRSGMGTKLPWDKEWIVETLSDSTIYMAYYVISKYVNMEKLKPANLTTVLLDYLLLGKGTGASVAKSSKLDEKLVRSIREEFLYWYPVDLRNSAKELIPNHLTFFAFHHAALFDEKLWPTGFSVNGMIQIEGHPMSKSHGVFFTWKQGLETYGADALRGALALAADGMEDADWRAKNAEDMRSKIESLVPFVRKSMQQAVKRQPTHIDRWLLSIMNGRIVTVTAALDEMRVRKAFSIAFLDVWNDLRWYMRRGKEWRQQTLSDVFSAWTRMLSPIIPFVAEELNKATGGKGLASQADWPSPKDFPVDDEAELSEVVVTRVLEDARNLLKVVKGKKQKLNIYAASDEAARFFFQVAKARAEKKKLGSVIAAFPRASIPPDRVVKLQYDIGEELLSKYLSLPHFDEFQLLSEASGFLSEELGLEVIAVKAGSKVVNDPESRAKGALPMKPAFFLE